MGWLHGVGATLVATAIFAPIPAFAADAAPSGRGALLLYGPEGPGADAEARALAAFHLLSPERLRTPAVRHVSSILGEIPTVEVIGGGDALTCPGSPEPPATFAERLSEVPGLLSYGDTDRAADLLERMEELLPCLDGVLPREDLADIAYLRAIALAFQGDQGGARESFRRALAVSPGLGWDARFPPGPEELFKEAFQLALVSDRAALVVESRVTDEVDLWVDGLQLTGGSTGHALAAGRHLLQWRLPDGGVETRVIEVTGEQHLAILSRADVLVAALDGTGSDLARGRAADALAGAAAVEGVERIYLANLRESDLLHVHAVTDRSWAISDEGDVVDRRRAQNRTRTGISMMIGGATLGATGLIVGWVGYSNAKTMTEPTYTDTLHTPDQYALALAEYEPLRTQAHVGWGMAGTGAAVLVAGVSVAIASARSRGAEPGSDRVPLIGLTVVPGGAGIGGRF